ncbi:MAG: sulfite exporter TauE/SafE family protein [Flavobacteriaceae bacterium]|jgi:uncharacterized membrane protein YfcA|nr:sulfite exporter TauE/SafE family protein [Flavobacteriaceae bacterium]MDG2314253.1 sulfite exporter TauE/SafE family protein [Flavobacteriaceae bacterium]
MEVIGFTMALVVGLSLGFIGSGGSILAVPVLTYLFLLDEKVATAYSLFIVGSAALIGGLHQHRSNFVDWRTALVFGLPALLGVWMVRFFVVPVLPDVFFQYENFFFTRRMAMFGLFALLMVGAAYSMLFSKHQKGGTGIVTYNYPLILVEGLFVGALSGLVGAGGGFLIIPALVILANLEIKRAIGTSLIIVSIKSVIGFFLADAMIISIDWNFLMTFTSITIVGIFLGLYLSKFLSSAFLKRVFGYFIMIMAVFVFVMEFFVKT